VFSSALCRTVLNIEDTSHQIFKHSLLVAAMLLMILASGMPLREVKEGATKGFILGKVKREY
jgi:hypothetical protein